MGSYLNIYAPASASIVCPTVVCRDSQSWGPASLPSTSPSSRKVGSLPTLQGGMIDILERGSVTPTITRDIHSGAPIILLWSD